MSQHFVVVIYALFRRFFETEKWNPQIFLLLECMNVKEIKNILHDYVAFENKNHAIKTQKNAIGQCLNETVS